MNHNTHFKNFLQRLLGFLSYFWYVMTETILPVAKEAKLTEG